ncbi:hypothetical protein [Elioraea sp.]|uniref:hypothetical protein n=1 Tax=Elioraea sp. TaxID=2185103 RepID=UPI0025BFE091|nr:hypothetical protein [Elioraea sp.]
MAASMRPPPPGASPSGLYECLRALAEEAKSIGLSDAARAILLAADCVAVEAEENGLTIREPARPTRGVNFG